MKTLSNSHKKKYNYKKCIIRLIEIITYEIMVNILMRKVAGLAFNQLLEIWSVIIARYFHYHVQVFVGKAGSEFVFYIIHL